MLDDNWFGEIKEYLAAAGFRSWVEDQEYMLPAGENLITPNPEVEVRKVAEWQDELEKVFREAEEPWEIKVARKTSEYPKAWMFAAYLEEKPVGLLYGHISESRESLPGGLSSCCQESQKGRCRAHFVLSIHEMV